MIIVTMGGQWETLNVKITTTTIATMICWILTICLTPLYNDYNDLGNSNNYNYTNDTNYYSDLANDDVSYENNVSNNDYSASFKYSHSLLFLLVY